MKYINILLMSLLISSCGTNKADTIYQNGTIITMNDDQPYAKAVAISQGKILAVGSIESMDQYKNNTTKIIDLEKKALLPGFVDAHGHTFLVGMQSVSANLYPSPDGEANSIDDITDILQEYYDTDPPLYKDIGWLVGWGYDDASLKEKRHPTKMDLDKVFPDIPVYLVHQSGHLGVANSKALELLNITAETEDPIGGIIRRMEGSQEPNGVLEESAHINASIEVVKFSPLFAAKTFLSGVDTMTSFGFTTAQEGRASGAQIIVIKLLALLGQLPIDIVVYPDIYKAPKWVRSTSDKYSGRMRIGGAKLSLDGSPQGKTAWRDRPYVVPPYGQDSSYVGYPGVDLEDASAKIDMVFASNWQILVHANGERAIDFLIDEVDKARAKHTNYTQRPVLIHGQFLRKDQVEQLKRLNIIPSLYPLHTFYWGDWHREQTIGEPGVNNISPTKWVEDAGMKFTIHADAPIVPPDSMRILWTAVNRISRSGKEVGLEQRISVMTGLKAMTIWSAYQHGEEDTKGSLEVGKLADLVILSSNPLEIDPLKITDIQVLETIKEGKTIYKR